MIVTLTPRQREAEAVAAEAREHYLLAARIRRGDDIKPRMLAEHPDSQRALEQAEDRRRDRENR